MSETINVLVAYPYFTDTVREVLQEQEDFRLIIDSGAFTAWNTGATVTMEGYTAFLRSIPKSWSWRGVQLDVYGNPKATYDNWRRMVDDGWHDIMPVFTRGEIVERLDEFYSVTDYVMFGGIAFGGKNKNYVKWFSGINRGRRVHWLGFSEQRFIRKFRPESCDASSALSCERYGRIAYTAPDGRLTRKAKVDFAKHPGSDFLASALRCGFTANEIRLLGKEEAWRGHGRYPRKDTLRGFASFVSHVHCLRHALTVERNFGTKFYFAYANPKQLRIVFDARRFMRERGVL